MKKICTYTALAALSAGFFAQDAEAETRRVITKPSTTKIISRPKAVKKHTHKVNGSAEAGATVATGNTERESYNAGVTINHEYGKWGNVFTGTALFSEDGEVKSAERYTLGYQGKYNFTNYDYAFIDVFYDKDKFSGYEWRLSETVGYGRHILKGERTKLLAEISVGARHSEEIGTGDKTDEMIGKLRGLFSHQIRDGIEFIQDASIEFGDELGSVIISDSTLKTKLYENIGFKINHNIKHTTDVPVGTEKTDQITSLSLLYDF